MEVDGRYVITEPGVPKDKEVPTEKPLIPLRQPKVLNNDQDLTDLKSNQSSDATCKLLDIPPIKPRIPRRKSPESDVNLQASAMSRHLSSEYTTDTSPATGLKDSTTVEIKMQETKQSEINRSTKCQNMQQIDSKEYPSYSSSSAEQSLQSYRIIPATETESKQYIEMQIDDSKTTTVASSTDIKSYPLETFLEKYSLPQLVFVTEGHYGLTEDFSMSEEMELILFFKKKTRAVIATSMCETDPYYIPLNCSLQFSPYQSDCTDHLKKSYYYKTVTDLLARPGGLPKVVKVLSPYKANKQTILRPGDLIFPKQITGLGFMRRLECTTSLKDTIKLELSCAAGFSTNPSDTKMYLIEYIEHIKLPDSAMVFCDKERNEAFSHIHTGMEFTLLECKSLHSCICSIDVYGKENYPLLEILTAMPIEIKISDNPNISMGPIYDTVKRVYQTFDLSMVSNSMLLTDNEEQSFYEEMWTADGTVHVYDLERPEGAFAVQPATKHNLTPPKLQISLKPPIQGNNPLTISSCTASFPQPWSPVSTSCVIPKSESSGDLASPDENRAYLRSLDVADILRVLDKMNLGQYKNAFQKNNVNGKNLLSFTTAELQELEIESNIHRKRLLKLINGNISYRLK